MLLESKLTARYALEHQIRVMIIEERVFHISRTRTRLILGRVHAEAQCSHHFPLTDRARARRRDPMRYMGQIGPQEELP